MRLILPPIMLRDAAMFTPDMPRLPRLSDDVDAALILRCRFFRICRDSHASAFLPPPAAHVAPDYAADFQSAMLHGLNFAVTSRARRFAAVDFRFFAFFAEPLPPASFFAAPQAMFLPACLPSLCRLTDFVRLMRLTFRALHFFDISRCCRQQRRCRLYVDADRRRAAMMPRDCPLFRSACDAAPPIFSAAALAPARRCPRMRR